MAKVLFISERSIKDNSIIEDNTDSKIVRLTVEEVQLLELQPILGKALYSEIEAEIIAKSTSTDPAFEMSEKIVDLLEVIKPFLIYGVLANIQTPLTYKATNKGFNVKNDTNSTSTSGANLEYVKRYYNGKFDAFKSRLLRHLKSIGCGSETAGEYSTGWNLRRRSNSAEILENLNYKIR